MGNKLPREIAPGVFWIGDCLAQRHKGKIYHGYNAAFLVAGETASCLVETGHPKDFPVIARHMDELFARGVAPLKYLFVTHQETPHCGGLGRILKAHPEAILCGDVSDYHLAFPQYEHRMRWMKEGDEIDLGGRTLMAVEPVIRDLRTTWWGFDTRERVLFPGDGFAYSHYHEDGHCGLVAEEATSLDLPDVSSTFADLALFWTKFADMNAYCDRLDLLIERLGVKTIAPTHGLPITDVRATVPKVHAGLKAAALMPESGTNREGAADRRGGGANGGLTCQTRLERLPRAQRLAVRSPLPEQVWGTRSAHAAGRDLVEIDAGRFLGRKVDVDVVAVRVPDIDLHRSGARHLARLVAHLVALQAANELLQPGGREGEVLEL